MEKKFFEYSEKAQRTLSEANQKMSNTGFKSIQEIRVMSENLFKRIEELDSLDLSLVPTLRQERKEAIRKIQILCDTLDHHVRSVAELDQHNFNFKNSNVTWMSLLQHSYSIESGNATPNLEFLNELSKVDHKDIASSLQTYRLFMNEFHPLSLDVKTRKEEFQKLITDSFKLLLNIVQIVQPFYQQLSPITHAQQVANQFIQTVESQWKTNGLASLANTIVPNSTCTYSQLCAHHVNVLKKTIVQLETSKDSSLLKEVRSIHISQSMKALVKLEMLSNLLNICPVLQSVSELLANNGNHVTSLKQAQSQLQGISKMVENLKYEEGLDDLYYLQIAQTQSSYMFMSSQLPSIISFFTSIEEFSKHNKNW
ncbi:hypothetical protein C9374_001584 [Naegleria lovaniensis]|uniref:BAG domain-containing protein n=1 Tax=Naegleria lovaniensis TaxID=51637 RepID=A0AA88KRD6_NAELO|nr:uncharacterized protein C9374_001584 [Naegleria lovaniensis]KAG2387252.1 hypothetical protein C9374_001584 [Naegleria lovaniensis]